MEEGAGYARGDGDQFPLAAEDFDLASLGEFGQIDGASAADAEDGGFVGGDRWEVGEQFAGVDEEGFESGGRRYGRNPRSLRSAIRSLRERIAPVGMTILRRVGGL